MRALLSLVVGTLMLNFSVNAGSSSRSSADADAPEAHDEDVEAKKSNHAWEQQEMEDAPDKNRSRHGFEAKPNKYRPHSSPEERIQTSE